jgi:hypothetical protein
MECGSHVAARRACRGALQHSVRPFLSALDYIIRRSPIQAACQTDANGCDAFRSHEVEDGLPGNRGGGV